MSDTLDRIISIARGLGYDRAAEANGATTLVAVAGNESEDAKDILAEIEEEFRVTLADRVVTLPLADIAVMVDRQVEAIKAGRGDV